MNTEQQMIGRLKNAGSGLEIAGLIIVIMNLFTSFVLSKSMSLISFIFILNILLGIIFILLGWKIHKNINTAKWRLVVALIFAALLLILNFYNDQTSGMAIYIPAVMFASSHMGLDAVKKLRNLSLGILEVEPQDLKGIDKAKDILKMVIAAIVIIGFFIAVSY